jgi:hypothetical protein
MLLSIYHKPAWMDRVEAWEVVLVLGAELEMALVLESVWGLALESASLGLVLVLELGAELSVFRPLPMSLNYPTCCPKFDFQVDSVGSVYFACLWMAWEHQSPQVHSR